jgi:hypothetical protein
VIRALSSISSACELFAPCCGSRILTKADLELAKRDVRRYLDPNQPTCLWIRRLGATMRSHTKLGTLETVPGDQQNRRSLPSC